MNPWKISTLLMAILFTVSAIGYRQAKIDLTDSVNANSKIRTEIESYYRAVSDTQSLLNWYRVSTKQELTESDYERHLDVLKMKLHNHFPEWAKTQSDGE